MVYTALEYIAQREGSPWANRIYRMWAANHTFYKQQQQLKTPYLLESLKGNQKAVKWSNFRNCKNYRNTTSQPN